MTEHRKTNQYETITSAGQKIQISCKAVLLAQE